MTSEQLSIFAALSKKAEYQYHNLLIDQDNNSNSIDQDNNSNSINQDDNTNKFIRDRDRILFSKEFRRLNGKTQVFVNGFDDNIRNRLTHTLEVSQIATTLCKNLSLNPDLAEAIALAHDVGHTPFGHVGERFLNQLMNGCFKKVSVPLKTNTDRGFKHNLQSLKVVTELEKISNDFKGLNLTKNTLWGIVNHSKLTHSSCNSVSEFPDKYQCLLNQQPCVKAAFITDVSFYTPYLELFSKETDWTFEGYIVAIADEIAQRHHDLEDGIRAGIISKQYFKEIFTDIFNKQLGGSEKALLEKINNCNNPNIYFHCISSLILGFYFKIIESNYKSFIEKIIDRYHISNSTNFYNLKSTIYSDYTDIEKELMGDELALNDKSLHDKLINQIINSELAQQMDAKSSYILRKLVEAYNTNPKWLPDSTILTFYNTLSAYNETETALKFKTPYEVRENITNIINQSNGLTILNRVITDYIAGMTDNYAIFQYKQLYGSSNPWSYL